MYKLENNVQWTENLKNAFKHGITRASISYTDDNSNLVTLNENNALIELTLEDNKYVKDMGFIGSACAKKLEFTIQDANNDYDLENKELTLKIGADYNNSTYYINYGNFIVNEAPQIDETNGKIKVVAYDYMIKFNKPYEDQVNYPVTLLALLQNICTQAGVTLDTTDFNNYDFIVTDNQFQGATLREVLQNIGKCAFSWARIGQDNQLYLDFSQTADEEETLTIDDYKTNGFKKSKDYYGPVNQVTYADSDIEGQEERVYDESSIQQNGLKELVIYDNLFAYTPEKRQQLIAAGTSLFNLTYMPVSQLDSIGFIYLDCNDIISIETLDEQSYNTRIFNHTIKYNGATSDSIETEGTSLNQDAYKNTASNIFQNQQTRIIVDKANKTINSIVEEIGDRSQKTTTITQDIDGIQSLVQDIEDLTVTVTGTRTITLEKCLEGYLLNLNIYGNNVVFDYLYPEDDLYPANDLYPRGDSRIVVTNEDGTSFTYELRITEVLRSNSETYDEYILEDNHAKVIRRVNADGTTKVVPTEEDIGTYTINLKKGTNTITIKNYYANISARYIPENSYTNQFATTAKMTSAITQSATEIMANVTETFETKENAETNYSEIRQTAQEISSEVSRKVGDDEVISKINQSAEAVTINADKISLAGKELNFTSQNITISSDALNIDKYGKIRQNGRFGTNDVPFEIYSNTHKAKNDIYSNSVRIEDPYNNVAAFMTLYDTPISSSYVYSSVMGMSTPYGSAYIAADSNDIPFYKVINDSTYEQSTLAYNYMKTTTCKAQSYENTSLESYKKNISKFDKKALDIIKNSDIYEFNYNQEDEKQKKHIGLIIGEKYSTPNELISQSGEAIELYSFVSICCKAIQEQQEEIENLQKEIKLLKGEKDE